MDQTVVSNVLETIPAVLRMPSKHVWFDFDESSDTLYVSFERPQQATDTELTDDGLLIRYRDGRIVGVTILNASKRLPAEG